MLQRIPALPDGWICRRPRTWIRGVWLDRGELERVVEQERRVVGAIDDDEEDFVREMTGHGEKKPDKQRYGFDAKTSERIYSDYRTHRKHKKRKSFLDELFD